jgi:predicted metalloendopeptidase
VPCDDFYRFANGGWMTANPVPDDRASWSAYAEVNERTRETLRAKLWEAAESWESAATGSGERKLGLFFACCMDSERVEREGDEPLEALLSQVEMVRDTRTLAETFGSLHRIGVGVPFELGATSDPEDASMMIAELSQGGLTLPVSTWYLNEGEDFESLREEYLALVQRAFELLGHDAVEAGTKAVRVLELETLLARATMSREARRDPNRVTNRMTRAEVRAMTPSVDWAAYFESLGVPEPEEYNVAQPEFLTQVDHLLTDQAVAAWRSYLSWWLVRRASRFLDSHLAALDGDLRALWSGSVAPPPRIRMCESLADFALGETLGRQWAQASFPPAAKATAEEMVDNILAVFRDRIQELEWMSSATRQEALAKLRTMDVRIGYPDETFDHTALELHEEDSLLEMVADISRFRVDRDLSRIGRPDPDLWALNPQRLTGAYIPARNAIEYPAAKFQPPFFDANRDPAMNYGAIGATIAHEITHALDDQGRQYDAEGNLRDWWTDEDAAQFEAAASRLVEQFDDYVVLDSVRVNGTLTLGENIADLGGVTLAFHAWRRSLNGAEPDLIDGFTGEQRFFLAWAHNWRETIRPEELKTDVERDVHAPSYWRVNGPLSNLPEFAEAFGCRPDAPMVRRPDRRVRVW